MYKKKLTFSGKINNFEKLMQQETYFSGEAYIFDKLWYCNMKFTFLISHKDKI